MLTKGELAIFGNDKAVVGQVTIELTPRSFSVWSAESHAWVGVSGKFEVMVGSSSRDIRLTGTIERS